MYAWFGDEAWLFPALPPGAGSRGLQPRVVVVMLDERALALRGARWPVPVEFHAQFLAELEVLKPRGIFLDFLLLDPAPAADTCELLRVAARLRAERIALYVAVTRTEDLTLLESPGCQDPQGAPIRAREVFIPVAVVRQVDNSDFVSRRYPFEQRSEAQAPGSGVVSAAVRMYCEAGPDAGACLTRLRTRFGGRRIRARLVAGRGPVQSALVARAVLPRISPMRAILNGRRCRVNRRARRSPRCSPMHS